MLDRPAAERVRQFFCKFLSHTKGRHAGQRFDLLPWQWEEIVLPLYGTKKEDGTRQYKRASIWICKKVGKTTLAAGFALYHLIADGEPFPEIYIIASTIDEADTMFRQICSFIRANEDLAKICKKPNHNLKLIELRDKEGFIKVLSGDRPEGKSGKNASLVLGDEVGHRSPFQATIWADLQYAGAAREQPLYVTISTSSYDLDGYGYGLFKRAKQVKEDPAKDPTLLPVIYSAPIGADPFDPETWKLACPSLGAVIKRSDYEEEALAAKDNPRLLDDFCTYRLCQWRSAPTTWIPHHVWKECRSDFAEEQFHGQECFIGLDAGSKHDLFAYVVLLRQGEDIWLLPRAFIPRDNARRKEIQDGVDYTTWEKRGWIYQTEGDIVDVNFVKATLLEDCKRFRVRELGYDPAAGAELLMQDLRDNHGVFTVSEPQAYTALSPACHYFEQLVYKKQLHVPANDCLDWCLNNCEVKRNAEKIGLDNKNKGTARNDLIQATLIGLRRILANPIVDNWIAWLG